MEGYRKPAYCEKRGGDSPPLLVSAKPVSREHAQVVRVPHPSFLGVGSSAVPPLTAMGRVILRAFFYAPASFRCFSRCSRRMALRDSRILLPSIASTFTST